jgi:nucleotide-binding universal stress UspA family protein
MFPPKTILVPTDFSELSKKAVRYAERMARESSAKLIVLHVDPPLLSFADTPQDPTVHVERLRKQLNEIRPANVAVEHRLVDGFAADVINQTARETSADVIVIATHGRTGMAQAFLGSVAQSVLRGAHCPVLTINPLCGD